MRQTYRMTNTRLKRNTPISLSVSVHFFEIQEKKPQYLFSTAVGIYPPLCLVVAVFQT
jgi:hypothetical protein